MRMTKRLQNRLQFNNWSIQYKLIFHYLLISILPSLGISLLMAWTVNGIVGKQANEHTMQLIDRVNLSIDNYAGNIQNISYFISMDPDIQSFLNHGAAEAGDSSVQYRMSKFFQGFTALYSEIAGIMIVAESGDYFSNDMYARSSRKLTEEDWYRQATEAKGIFKIIGHPVNRNVTTHAHYKDSELISVVRAVQDPDSQRTKGVVLIDLKLRVIAEALRDVRLGKSGYLMVLNEEGERIYAPRQALETVVQAASKGREQAGLYTETIEGKELQFIYRKSAFTNWTTVGVFDMQDNIREIREINQYLIVFVFIVSMMGIAASYYLSYSISRPISQLSSSMRKVEEGNMNVRIPGERTDEVGLLGRSFNAMLKQIKRLITQVREEQRLKREAELRSLQAHIQPHFLYNTLDTIQWLARKDGAVESAEMVEALSKLFRIGLSKGKEMIPLSDELEHIRSYLTIQKTRYKEKLNGSIEAPPDGGDLMVLKLILQPVVENAIYHGIKERRGPGRISIRVATEGDVLVLTVADDGAGMTPERLKGLRESLEQVSPPEAEADPAGHADIREGRLGGSSGYGLRNVQERIRLSFGQAYGIEVESERSSGTRVVIRHPIIRKKEREA